MGAYLSVHSENSGVQGTTPAQEEDNNSIFAIEVIRFVSGIQFISDRQPEYSRIPAATGVLAGELRRASDVKSRCASRNFPVRTGVHGCPQYALRVFMLEERLSAGLPVVAETAPSCGR